MRYILRKYRMQYLLQYYTGTMYTIPRTIYTVAVTAVQAPNRSNVPGGPREALAEG